MCECVCVYVCVCVCECVHTCLLVMQAGLMSVVLKMDVAIEFEH